MSEQRPSIDEIFLDAIEIADESLRAAYLERACGGDRSLRDRVDKLLLALPKVGAFMEEPVFSPATNANQNSSTPNADLIGQVFGPYKLIQKIGEGGMGVVYLAEQDEPIKRRVALKIIRTGMDTAQFIARFEHERQALALMEHPNIARVIDAGAAANGLPYFAMELVQGVPITTYCDQAHLSINERIQLLIPVCLAVQHAHQKGIVHRDLKPSNVIVAIYDGKPVPKVIDFGVAKATAQRLTERSMFTELGQMIGTLEYMAPEQAEPKNLDIDTRADIYSLGVLLYELLTGAPPFTAQELRAAGMAGMLRMVQENEPDKPSTKITTSDDLPRVAANRRLEPRRLASLIRGDLDWISMKCLEKDRARRYESANGLASDLERYLSNEPVLACPPTAQYRLGKFIRKHRAPLTAAAGFVLLLAVSTFVSTWLAYRAVTGWNEAEKQRTLAQDVNQFMSDVLTSVEPDQKGADVRLLEVLDDASKTASQRFVDNPAQEGYVRMMLGEVYTRLDFYRKATAEYDKAVQVFQSVFEPTDRRLLNAQSQHARALLNQASNRPAEKILAVLVPFIRTTLGPNDLLVIDTERLQAVAHARAGRYDEADKELCDLRLRAESISADDALHIRLLDSLIPVRQSKLGRGPAEDRSVLIELEPLAQEMADRSARSLGIDAVQTLRSRIIVAELKCLLGDYPAAADVCAEILNTSEERLGKCHGQRLLAMKVLADAKHRLGDSAGAAALILQRLECSKPEDISIVRVSKISDALPVLDRGNRWMEGESLARELSADLIKLGGGHGNMLFVADLSVARFVSLQGRSEEAEALFQALQSRVGETADDNLTRARLRLYYGSHLRTQKRFDASEKEIQAAADTVPDIRQGTCGHNPDDIIVEFIALYDDWGKPEEAVKFREMLATLQAAPAGETPNGEPKR